jgi:NAD+ synthase (glutamine-hydrolysing)
VAVPEIKVGLAQTNPVVGDYENNAAAIDSMMAQAHSEGLDLVVFGELALNGYPLGDLSYRRDVIQAGELSLEHLIKRSEAYPGLTIVLGHAALSSTGRSPIQSSDAIATNSASVFSEGKLVGRYDKQRLPNYDVFDDWRNFIPGNSELIFEVAGIKCAIAICEDIWDQDSVRGSRLKDQGVELIVVPNGSPYTRDKASQRRAAAKDFSNGISIAYVNLAGGQDELVFDGDSFLLDASGKEIVTAGLNPGLFSKSNTTSSQADHYRELFDVLVIGLRDYLRKTGQGKVVLGLSGGIDSALCAAIAKEAVGPENVTGVLLPSRYSSDHSLSDARLLAENLGIEHRTIEIDAAHRAFESSLSLSDLAQENIQARIRAVILMGISNSEGHLLISTGNKSEVAVGYSTMYGDAAGGFAPIKDVYKTDVWKLAETYNKVRGFDAIPRNSITKPPSAELRPGQLDQDSLPDYEVLDGILALLIEDKQTSAEIVSQGFDAQTVARIDGMVRASEWKRSQGAIGTKTTAIAFGRGRRVPLTTRFGTL